MTTHKCKVKSSPNYEVKQRYIPTYVHEQIFQDAPLRPYSSRCTPTFHSTVFDTDGYNIKTVHSKNVPQLPQAVKVVKVVNPQQSQTVVCCHNPNQQICQSTSGQNKGFNVSRDKWFDHTKEEIFSLIPNSKNHGYSKERKFVDLSSDPVFTDFVYENNLVSAGGNTVHVHGRCCREARTDNVRLDENIGQTNVALERPSIQQQQPRVVEQVINEQVEPSVPTVVEVVPQKSSHNRNPQQSRPQASLKLKGKKIETRPLTAQKSRAIQEKPTFTVVRKSRVNHNK